MKATGKAFAKAAKSKKREGFLGYMDDLLMEYPEQDGMEFHIIMDN